MMNTLISRSSCHRSVISGMADVLEECWPVIVLVTGKYSRTSTTRIWITQIPHYLELNFLSLDQNFTEIYTDNLNSPLTRTVFCFPSEFESLGFYCNIFRSKDKIAKKLEYLTTFFSQSKNYDSHRVGKCSQTKLSVLIFDMHCEKCMHTLLNGSC